MRKKRFHICTWNESSLILSLQSLCVCVCVCWFVFSIKKNEKVFGMFSYLELVLKCFTKKKNVLQILKIRNQKELFKI